MGCGASAPRVDEVKPRPAAAAHPAAPKVPCRGLCDTHEYIQELGKGEQQMAHLSRVKVCLLAAADAPDGCAGGTGETFLYKDKETGGLVAVKLIRRPLPKVIQANILREIMVRPSGLLSLQPYVVT